MPHRLFWKLALPIALLSACNSTQNRTVVAQKDVAIPATPVADVIEARKYKVVRRTYELTDDMLVYCAQVPYKQRVAHQKLSSNFGQIFRSTDNCYSPHRITLKFRQKTTAPQINTVTAQRCIKRSVNTIKMCSAIGWTTPKM